MFKQERVKYNGHILTTEGMLPDPAKVEAITEMPVLVIRQKLNGCLE
jgi:hypothetical protein